MTNDNVLSFPTAAEAASDVASEDVQAILDGEAPAFHPILEVWREVLKPFKTERERKVTPQWASRICQSYAQLTFADMETYRDVYYGKLEELYDLLLLEISTDDQCLTYSTPAEDAAENSAHYKSLLLDWQIRLLQWEMAWECTSPTAAVELAAISEIHKLFFGQTGLTAFLDNIGFEFSEDDSREMQAALEALKEGQ